MTEIRGKYVYDMATGNTVGKSTKDINKNERTDYNYQYAYSTNTGYYKENIAFSLLKGVQQPKNSGTVEQLSFEQIINLFVKGKMVTDELKIGLESKGINDVKFTEKNGITTVTFTKNNKSYTLKCATDAAASQIDKITADVDDESITEQAVIEEPAAPEQGTNTIGDSLAERVLGLGKRDLSNLTSNEADIKIDSVEDFDKTSYSSFVDSIVEHWEDTTPLHNGVFNTNMLGNLLNICKNGLSTRFINGSNADTEYGVIQQTDITDLSSIIFDYFKEAQFSSDSNAQDRLLTKYSMLNFSKQFVDRFINIILNDEEVKNIEVRSLDSTDIIDKQKAINNSLVKLFEKLGATKDSDGNYTNIDTSKIVNYVLEYDEIPHTSPIYGTQFNSLKDEIEYYRTNGVTEYNEKTKNYFYALANYNSANYSIFEYSDANPYDYASDIMHLMRLPMSGSTSYDDLVDKQVNRLVLSLQTANERGALLKTYNPNSNCLDYTPNGRLTSPIMRVGIDSNNNITITDDSIGCVQKYLKALESKNIDPANDDYCKLFGFSLNDDKETINKKLNKFYSTMEGAVQDNNGNYKVPLKSYYTTLSNLGISNYDEIEYINQVGADALSLFSKEQLNEAVERMNLRAKVDNTIVDYGFTIEDICYLAGGANHTNNADDFYIVDIERNSNDMTLLTESRLSDLIEFDNVKSQFPEELINSIYKAAGINPQVDSKDVQHQKMQSLVDKWFDEDGTISPEKFLVLLTGVDGGTSYVRQNTYSEEFVTAFCMQNNNTDCAYLYNIDEWFEKLDDGSYVLKPGKRFYDGDKKTFWDNNRRFVNNIFDLDPYHDNLKHNKELLDMMEQGKLSQDQINSIIESYQNDQFMKAFYDDIVAVYDNYLKPEQVETTPKETSAKEENVKTESAKTDTAKSNTAKPEPAKTESAKTDTAKSNTAKPEPAKTESAKTDTAKSNTAKPESAKPDTAKSNTAKPDTAKT